MIDFKFIIETTDKETDGRNLHLHLALCLKGELKIEISHFFFLLLSIRSLFRSQQRNLSGTSGLAFPKCFQVQLRAAAKPCLPVCIKLTLGGGGGREGGCFPASSAGLLGWTPPSKQVLCCLFIFFFLSLIVSLYLKIKDFPSQNQTFWQPAQRPGWMRCGV